MLFFPFPHLAAIVQKTYIREHQVVAADTSLHFELDYLLRDHARATRLGFLLLPPLFFFLVLCCGDREKEKCQTSYYVLVLTLTRCEKCCGLTNARPSSPFSPHLLTTSNTHTRTHVPRVPPLVYCSDFQ